MDESYSGAAAVARELQRRRLVSRPVSRHTVARAAVRAGVSQGDPIVVKRGKPIPALSVDTKAKRLAFARANLATDWQRVVFSDRKKFMHKYINCSAKRVRWCRKGTKPVATVASHPQAWNVYAALTHKGLTDVHVVAGSSKHTSTFITKQGQHARNITAAEYKCVLCKTLLPQARARVGPCFIFQQDNDPTHKAAPEIVHAYNKFYGTFISVLPNWPPHSPDLNLIENIWSQVQGFAEMKKCKTFTAFKAAVKLGMHNVSKVQINSLYESMKDRLLAVIEAEGDRIHY